MSNHDRDGEFLLHAVVRNRVPEVVTAFLDKGAPFSNCNPSGRTPLHIVANGGDQKVIPLLVHRGADPNAVGNDRCTPLHYTARLGYGKGNCVISEWWVGRYGAAKANLHESSRAGLEYAS